MYASHYGLTAKPFSIVPNPEILFLSKNHENALTYMEYGLREKAGFILLTGEIGSGKTTLVRYMLKAMPSRMDVAVIFNTNFSSDQLLRRILSEYEVPCTVEGKERYLELLYQFLIDRYAQGRHVLLIIDEAQNLSDEALEDIRMLSNLQTDEQNLLQIMLVGQTELRQRLNLPEFRQLAQRIAVNYHLTPLSEDQTHQYIAYRIEMAGGAAELFSPEAMSLVHDHAGGIPRTINLLCDAALVYGYADDLKHIDREAIEQVLNDKICLAATLPGEPVLSSTAPQPPIRADAMQARTAAIESALNDLQERLEALEQEVKCELYTKYQELLTAERNRYEQMMMQYQPLLMRQENQHHDAKMLRIEASDDVGPEADERFYLRKHKTWQSEGDAKFNGHANLDDMVSHVHEKRPAGNAAAKEPLDSIRPALASLILKKDRFLAFIATQFKTRVKDRPSSVGWRKQVYKITAANRRLLFIILTSVLILGLPLAIGIKHLITPEAPIAMPEASHTAPREPADIFYGKSTTIPVPEQEIVIHRIQAGETLSSIAAEYGISVAEIVVANKLSNTHLIHIGQTLNIPKVTGK